MTLRRGAPKRENWRFIITECRKKCRKLIAKEVHDFVVVYCEASFSERLYLWIKIDSLGASFLKKV